MSNEKEDEFSLEMFKAMDIVRGMSQEEIKELLLNNPLYKYIIEMDKEGEKNNGIPEKTD